MEKINKIINMCLHGVYIHVNQHKDYNLSIKDFINIPENRGVLNNVNPDILSKMSIKDSIIVIQCFPFSGGGYHIVVHHNFEEAVDLMYKILGC